MGSSARWKLRLLGGGDMIAAQKLITLEFAVLKIVEKHGGLRAAARATGVDKAFISRLMNGHKTAPSAETLRALGLHSVPLYEILPTNDLRKK